MQNVFRLIFAASHTLISEARHTSISGRQQHASFFVCFMDKGIGSAISNKKNLISHSPPS